MKTIISFDTETTGLLKPEENPLEDQPRIFEFGAVKYDQDGNELDSMLIVLDPGIPLPPIITKITGRNDDYVRGRPKFVEAYQQIADFFVGTHVLTAHNLAFDRDMLCNSLLMIDRCFNFPFPPKQICTVKSSMKYCGYRLNLTKLHQYLFDCEFAGAHSAMGDVKAQAKCFFEMVERGDIKL